MLGTTGTMTRLNVNSHKRVFSNRMIAVVFVIFCLITTTTNNPLRTQRGRSPKQEKVVPFTSGGSKYEFCFACMTLAETMANYITANKTFEDLRPYAIFICDLIFTKRGYNGEIMCPGFVDSYAPPIFYIASRAELKPQTFCEKLNFCKPDIRTLKNQYINSFHVNTKKKRSKRSKPRTKRKSRSILRVLQLTDIHVDPSYSQGSAVQCDLLFCCRSNFNGTGSAGYYGEYECDLPVPTLDLVLSTIRKLDPAPDFIVYTGDSPPHDLWLESWTTQLNIDDLVVKRMASILKNFTIYPTIGNHEGFPVSLYYQPGADYQHLNTELADWWGSWFDVGEEQRETIQHSAYYTTLIRPGLRLLSFNSNYGYVQNYYCLLNDRIAAYKDQITFMKKILAQSRENGEKVIITAHVPPGDPWSSTLEYGDFYTSLITNYSDVITLQLFGHTHNDMFEMVLNPYDGQTAEGVVFIAPSVTTHVKVNPGFRVYHLDSETFELLDYDQHYLNITEANHSGKTDMKRLYSAKAEYGLPDMSPESWKNLTKRFETDDALFKKYRRNYLTGSGLEGPCDAKCKKNTICNTKSASLRALLQCL